nr:MAG TPA: hypothetical protein [Caudoviricetes sp.]
MRQDRTHQEPENVQGSRTNGTKTRQISRNCVIYTNTIL